VRRLPPALAASATPQILELLGDGPGRVLELGFAGIHAVPLELAGWDVVVVEPDPSHAERAHQRGGQIAERAEGHFDAVVAPLGASLDAVDAAKIVIVDERGIASMSR
jgi:hypothetical protein